MAGSDQLSRVFSALADPTRRAILAELVERDATVTELSAPYPMSMPAVSRHLKMLEEAGFQRWTEVSTAQPDLRVHIHIDLTDVADGDLLDATLAHIQATATDAEG